MTLDIILTSYWPQLIGLVAVVVSLARTESRTRTVEKQVLKLEEQREADLRASREARLDTNTALMRLEDKMDRGFRDVQGDIKELIKQRV